MNFLTQRLPPQWFKFLEHDLSQPYWDKLAAFVENEYQTKTIYPPESMLFTAFDCTQPEDIAVVIIGQDPYHGEGQAHGLSFSVPDNTPLPPSLKNIYNELKRDCHIDNFNRSSNLTSWAQQGVLLINAVLTVEKGRAGSHANKGWEQFTDNVISKLNTLPQPIIFLLWGNYAIEKKKFITSPHHILLETSHPSPLSVFRGFDGCGHFSQVNRLLAEMNRPTINWETNSTEKGLKQPTFLL